VECLRYVDPVDRMTESAGVTRQLLTKFFRRPWRIIMAVQIVMDHSGDSRYPFNPNDAEAVAKAEKRFYELTGIGFTATVRIASGEVSQVRSFDPTAEETLFFPRLVGG
jgi:hypothetical protein